MTIGRAPAPARWLLVHNCQAMGLANCLNLINSSIDVDYCDFTTFKKNSSEYLARLDSYDLVLTAPQFERTEFGDLSVARKIRLFPTVFFDGYHPDICYVNSAGALLKSPLGDYHSSLAFAAYKRGLSIDATIGLFNAKTYGWLGYFHAWRYAKGRLIEEFSDCGLDIRAEFQRWSAGSNFMYSSNHPSIRCLHDIARALVRSQGLAEELVDTLPHDNLLNGPIFPVYDEIAEFFSIRGSYRFKLAGKYRQISLADFVGACFAIYDGHEPAGLVPHRLYRKLHARTVAAI